MSPHVYSFTAPGHWRCLNCGEDVFLPVGEIPEGAEECGCGRD